jgi:threonyl-tRNA synthetase
MADKNQSLKIMRHSCAHVMAYAVKQLFPDVKLGIGPAIDNGFYYDFDSEISFSEQDLENIEKKMNEIIKEDIPFVKEDLSKEEAIKLFSDLGEEYKVELINEINEPVVTIYKNNDFVDLCKGPHIETTGQIQVFKLLNTAGAYWHGNEANKMLVRIYGAAFNNKKELRQYLHNIEEAKKRDHRKLGKELDLFSIEEEIGPGLILYHPKGAILRTVLEDYEKKEHFKRDYEMVMSPQILKTGVWKTSGHYQMGYPMYFFEIDNQEYGIKPMNCPGHILIYKSKIRSYRDLPVRYFELGTVHRHEKSGVLHGLMRVRAFTQDDAHIFCLPEQLKQEIVGVIDFIRDTLKVFGFDDFEVEISTRPEKSIGTDDDWEEATNALKDALDIVNMKYDINVGDGAFYGPKIDIKLKDAIGRTWQCATIQCDFALPDRFDLSYIGQDGQKHKPVMLHRVVFGSLERFMGILIEHYAGAFPCWMSPIQVKILTISENHVKYCKEIESLLKDKNIRVSIDTRNEKIGYKIREARLEKVPYMFIVGDKEAESNSVSVWIRGQGDKGQVSLDEIINEIVNNIDSRR